MKKQILKIIEEHDDTDIVSEQIEIMMIDFIEWVLAGNDGTFIQSHRRDDVILFYIDINEPFCTLKDVFNYWNINIRNK